MSCAVSLTLLLLLLLLQQQFGLTRAGLVQVMNLAPASAVKGAPHHRGLMQTAPLHHRDAVTQRPVLYH
jgi:hypothetical protein